MRTWKQSEGEEVREEYAAWKHRNVTLEFTFLFTLTKDSLSVDSVCKHKSVPVMLRWLEQK